MNNRTRMQHVPRAADTPKLRYSQDCLIHLTMSSISLQILLVSTDRHSFIHFATRTQTIASGTQTLLGFRVPKNPTDADERRHAGA